MRSFILHLLIFFCLAVRVEFAVAQSDKIAVGISPFTCSVKADSKGHIASIGHSSTLCQTLYGLVSAVFQNSQLFVIVERTRNDAIKQEHNFQKDPNFIGGSTQFEQAAFIGAEYIVTGNISSLSREQAAFSGDISMKVGYDIKVLNIVTSEVVAATHLEGEAIGKTNDAAFNEALVNTQNSLLNFLLSNFKTELSLIEIEGKTEKEAKTLVLAGRVNGYQKGSIIKITEDIPYNVEGKTLYRKKEVGQARVLDLEGTDFMSAEVSKNGADILNKFNAGVKLKATLLQSALVPTEPTPTKKKKKDQLNDFY